MPKNLLLADDSITIQKVVGIVFAGEDFKITAVDNGEDAVARARELRPDVILADVVMPRKNGYEVCEAIKADPQLQRIPVLLLAGSFEAFDDARARAARADGHIAKPFESQALLDKVKELVGGAQAQAPAPAAAAAQTTPSRPVGTTQESIVGYPPQESILGYPSPASPRAPVAAAPAKPAEPAKPVTPAKPAMAAKAATLVMPAAPVKPAAPLPSAAPQQRPAPKPAVAPEPAAGLPGGVPLPPGFRPPPAALQAMPRPPRFPPPPVVAGHAFASTLRPPPPPPAPVRPAVSAPPAPAATNPAPVLAPASVAPSGRAAWRDPFGLDVPEPRSPAAPLTEVAKAPAAPSPVSAPPPAPPPDPSLELDWSDLDVTEEESPEFAAPAQAGRGGPALTPTPTVATLDELDFGDVDGPPAPADAATPRSFEAMDLPELEPEEELAPESGKFAPLPKELRGGLAGAGPAPSPGAADGGEAALRDALSRASREVIERIAWEVVPQLAEVIIREQVHRLAKERQR